MNRPLAWVAAAFAAGTWAAAKGFCPGLGYPLALSAAGAAALFSLRARHWLGPLGVVLSSFAAGALLWNVRHTDEPGDPLSRYVAAHPSENDWVIEGTVRLSGLEHVEPGDCRFLLDVGRAFQGGEELPLHGGVAVRWFGGEQPVHAGERVRVRGRLSTALARVNPGTPSYEDYLRVRGIHCALRTRNAHAVERLVGAAWSPTYWVSRLRLTQARRLQQAVPESVLPFVLGVWLGYRSMVPPEEYQAYIESGTAHILAVSGLHMALIFASAWFLAGLLARGVRPRAAFTLLAVGLFVLMSGARPSCLRAALMVALYVAAAVFDREPDGPTALSVAGLLILGYSPDMLFDTGLRLSFLSIGSMLIFAGPIANMLRGLPRLLRGSIACTLAVQIAPLPVAVHAFHVLPIAAPLVNLAVVPATTFVLWLCGATTICALLLPDLAPLFGHALLPAISFIRHVASFASQTKALHPAVCSPTAAATLCYLGAAALCFLAMTREERRRTWLMCAALLAVAAVALWRPRQAEPMMVFLDVGHGDAAFFRSDGGTTFLIDGGHRNEKWDCGKSVVAPFLWANHIGRLDCVMVSHSDSDHIGGLLYIVGHFPVGQVFLNPYETGRPFERRLLELCAERGVPVRRLSAGDRLVVGGVPIEVLHPPRRGYERQSVNDQSLVVRIEWEDTGILFPGDIESAGEAVVSYQTPCQSDVLKVPHHGSRTSSSREFVWAVNPSEAIVSTGGEEGKEGVSLQILERYESRDIRVWRTDTQGGISLARREGRLVLEGARAQRGYVCP